ncbi:MULTISPECIES: ABC transporter ATP-binding protein [Pelosinus]|uniref:ABC transporter related protein n=1 Tax=Pelosinus fermentans B4 TaxID=1149862 RepID=I8R9Z5_9FIRM|nr:MULTISPECIES: ATP-binding cassette domain-containing protein [Pelosinus]EIW15663.1 ABC transporter related protein [Pelosinus fermentans B4]EIW26647.1 ABC transporter related protein [Pelosinus fermentans A11]OAM92408.1 ABC transporter related protein [Pelosinus fermentans DSM 17108]SDQ43871.1 peptide/nickel transport system ATP-binding protein [Pelosinus fermentans]
MILEAKGISFGYKKGVNILDQVQFTVESHERVGIVAPSGFGKTTLCQILAGYIKPASGQVLLDRNDIHKTQGYCPVQMIWQHPEKAVNPRLRMKDIIGEGDEIEERIINGLGIERDWFHRFPRELSGGEMQRFCIARALGKRTKFLIADEISTMLDLITQSQIWNFLLTEVTERKIGLIVVTHSNPLMERIATRQVVLDTQLGVKHHGASLSCGQSQMT